MQPFYIITPFTNFKSDKTVDLPLEFLPVNTAVVGI